MGIVQQQILNKLPQYLTAFRQLAYCLIMILFSNKSLQLEILNKLKPFTCENIEKSRVSIKILEKKTRLELIFALQN